jgi:hypothetical protein
MNQAESYFLPFVFPAQWELENRRLLLLTPKKTRQVCVLGHEGLLLGHHIL